MKTAKFTRLERRVRDLASRRARQQLMQVPWDRFHKAYEEYIWWQAFVLWARAVVESEGGVPPRLKAILQKRCPGFVQEVDRSNKPELLGLKLLLWVHHQAFGYARKEGWLDALVFYGFRDTRAQGYLGYREHCETEWKKRPPTSHPTFAAWRRSALRWKLHGDVSCTVAAKAVEKYLDFEAVVYWLRPLLQTAKDHLPAQVALELQKKCPGLLELMNKLVSGTCRDRSTRWRRLFNWGQDRVLSHAKKKGWFDVLHQVRIHPRHVRIADYARLSGRSRADNPASPHPSLEEWQREAEAYTRT